MKRPELVILAAGMGSRYGGLKQIDKVDEFGHIIIDYSIYDAMLAGFKSFTFIIKKEIEKDFREVMDSHLAGKDVEIKYVFQELDKLPEGYSLPEGRRKPWGTAHALLCCRGVVDAPFAVINADDYYGREAFKTIYDFLSTAEDDEKYHYAMVGYRIKNTVTEMGGVSRGVCESDEQGMLTAVTECHGIEIDKSGVISFVKDGERVVLDADTLVSMNLWGFTPSYIDECARMFPEFLDRSLVDNPEKCEFYIPLVVSNLLDENKCDVRVLDNSDKWYGVTYKEDKPTVVAAFARMQAEGKYPGNF
jgi:NDP-sugar pyrophosphorylase family protein